MESPGKLLREAREERGLTLDDVAAMTRIPKGMLQHLEQDRYEEYVADVFARGHIRNYANELRIDADEVLHAYERHTGRRRRKAQVTPIDGGPSEGVTGSTAVGKERGIGQGPDSDSVDESMEFGFELSGMQRSHFIAIALVLVGLFLMLGILSNNRATATDAAEYEQEESDWEREVEETQWLLDQNSADE